MKSKHVVFVHGLFGWGAGELGNLPYWGFALEQFKPHFEVHEVSCGPVSSFHDRACEVFAQIYGRSVNYGETHSKDAEHKNTSTDFDTNALVENWSEENPIILIGHSAGAQTCMQLQQLLADQFFEGIDTNARWIEAIVSVAGVINGSTLPYEFACDPKLGHLKQNFGALLEKGLATLNLFANESIKDFYNFKLSQWFASSKPENITATLEGTHFADKNDNLAFDLTLQGCRIANEKFKTQPDTYYLSIVTSQTFGDDDQTPEPLMNLVLRDSARYQGKLEDFKEAPIPGWGSGDLSITKWHENDGAVSSISQRYPFTAGSHLPGGEGIFERSDLQKGRWYWERAEQSTNRKFDHLDVVFGVFGSELFLNMEAHKLLYQNLCTRLRSL